MIEPAEGEGVVVETRVAEIALADDGVLGRALVTAVRDGRDDGVLFVGDFRAGGGANEVISGEIGRDADVIPGHHPKAGNVDVHRVIPQAPLYQEGSFGVRSIMPGWPDGVLSA